MAWHAHDMCNFDCSLTPLPAALHRFVIKTTESGGHKVFINVCGAPEVDAPGDWTDGQVHHFVISAGRMRAPIIMH